MNKDEIEFIAKNIVDSGYLVHKTLGPGLLESTYQTCLAYELRSRSLDVECELLLPIQYKNIKIDAGYRIDMLVENQIIIENKCVEKILPVHHAQLLTYMKLYGSQLGFLINWNTHLFKDGIKRKVNHLQE